MRLIVCAIAMIMGGACAHYYRSYSERDIVEPFSEWDRELGRNVDFVRCPVCRARSPIPGLEEGIPDECPGNGDTREINSVTFMRCKNGVFYNEKCHQWDCYRGEGEKCSKANDKDDVWGRQCAPGYYCNSDIYRCESFRGGSSTALMAFKNDGSRRHQLDSKQQQRSAFNLDDLIRLRRQA